MLENAGLPVPGETVLLAASAMAHFGALSLPWVIVAAAGGAILGDNIGFLIGRRGGRGFVERFGSRLGLNARRLAQFDRFFQRHGPKTVFVARFVTGLRVFGAILAGTSGLGWRTFLFYNATGALVWSTTIACAGYILGQSWETLERWIGRSGVIALAIVVIALLVFVIRARRAEQS
jgi:membrane protein DedA with SNARE-associated domain